MITKVYGIAGSGKTAYLFNKVLQCRELKKRVLYLAFTRAATHEIRRRLQAAGFTADEMDGVRTIHSLCYRYLGCPSIVSSKFWNELRDRYGYIVDFGVEDPLCSTDNLLQLYEYERHTGIPCRDEETRQALDRFITRYEALKREMRLVDFTDILIAARDRGITDDSDVLFVDEFQDLTPLQLDVVRLLMRRKSHIYFAGDPLQSIYEYAGAIPANFTNAKCDEQVILNSSHRVPQNILTYAHSLVKENKECYTDNMVSSNPNTGRMERLYDFESVMNEVVKSNEKYYILTRNRHYCRQIADFFKARYIPFRSNRVDAPRREPWDALQLMRRVARGGTLTYREMLKVSEFMHSGPGFWQLPRGMKKWLKLQVDADGDRPFMPPDTISVEAIVRAIREVLKSPFERMKLDTHDTDALHFWQVAHMHEDVEKRVFISTVHGVKGGQEDNVILVDAITQASAYQMDVDKSSENRIFYVGATRSCKSLTILHYPSSCYRYPL